MVKTTRKTLEQFKEEAISLWHGRYSYEHIKEYINNKTLMPITCPIHGDFMMNANNHLNGQGCRECRKQLIHDLLSLTTEEFINRAKEVHGDLYDYSETVYYNSNTKVKMKCKKHGLFEQLPFNHLNGHGCDKCAHEQNTIDRTLNQEEVINRFKQVHGDKYIYDNVKYKTFNIPVAIKCKIHGIFYQRPSAHINGQGCPFCRISLLEKQVEKLLTDNDIEFVRNYKTEWLINNKKLSLDFYLPKYNIAIECQGEQHFKPIEWFGGIKQHQKQLQNDKIKYDLCEEHGIKILYFSNLKIDYPYNVIEDEKVLLKEIQ